MSDSPEPIKIRLTEAETICAATTGALRHYKSVAAGLKDAHGAGAKTDWSGLAAHIEGAAGELAAARVLGLYFPASVDTFKDADLGSRTQVRRRSEHHWDLLVRKDDDPEQIFVLVTGRAPDLWIRGWLLGKEAKKPEFTRGYGGREKAFFVPVEHLRAISELFELE